MDVCSNCFTELELRAFINSSPSISKCSVCGESDVKVIELDELMDFFTDLFKCFQVSVKGLSLLEVLQSKWSFFSNHKAGTAILEEALKRFGGEIFASDSKVQFSQEILQNVEYWDDLKNQLKWSKRFLTDIEYLTENGLGWDSFFQSRFYLKRDDTLFRARLHRKADDEPYSFEQMNCPPNEKVLDGRANPLGIPFLYLSTDANTPLYEVRATLFDEVSLGEFKLIEDIPKLKIIDFIDTTPLYSPTDSSVDTSIKSELLKRQISSDLSKPMRKYDSIIEYIPTQFICEFIKTYTGADGIQFKSSVRQGGKNIVIFNSQLMSCVKVVVKKVTKLELVATDRSK